MQVPQDKRSSEDSAGAGDTVARKTPSRISYRKFVVDATNMAIFWTIVYTPVFLLTSRSLEAAILGLGSAAFLEILLGGVYGRFSDWFRAKLRVV